MFQVLVASRVSGTIGKGVEASADGMRWNASQMVCPWKAYWNLSSFSSHFSPFASGSSEASSLFHAAVPTMFFPVLGTKQPGKKKWVEVCAWNKRDCFSSGCLISWILSLSQKAEYHKWPIWASSLKNTDRVNLGPAVSPLHEQDALTCGSHILEIPRI